MPSVHTTRRFRWSPYQMKYPNTRCWQKCSFRKCECTFYHICTHCGYGECPIHRRPEYYEPQSPPPPNLDDDNLPPDTDESDSEWLEHLSQKHSSQEWDMESEEESGEELEEGLDQGAEKVDSEGSVLEADELEDPEVDSEGEVGSGEEEVDVDESEIDRYEELESEEEELEEELISWIVT